MTVFKATKADMACTMGRGIFQYHLGVPAVADRSKCGTSGLHACEYVLDCMGYYSLGSGNRFFLAEAAGDIAEDGQNTRIACTELTLVKELSVREVAVQAVLFMVRHPRRGGWQVDRTLLDVKEDMAEMLLPGGIAIARGREPLVRGAVGAHLGLVKETGDEIVDARVLTVGKHGIKPGVWYTVKEGAPEEIAIPKEPVSRKEAMDEI